MPDSNPDPAQTLRDEVSQLRDALRELRESVVLRVMRRNKLDDEVTRLEKRAAELDRGLGLAEQAQNTALAEEIRQERTRVAEELERFQTLRTQAEGEAEAAKIRLPEDEATLLRALNDLQARAQRLTAAQVEANAPGGMGSNADDLWERASGKIADLRREAQAREEIVTARAGQTPGQNASPSQSARVTPESSADQMLSDLEQRLGLSGPPANTPLLATARTSYLELDDLEPTEHAIVPESPESTAPNAPDLTEAASSLPSAPPLESQPIEPQPVAQPPQNESISSGQPEISASQPTQSTIRNRQSKISRESSRMEPTERVRIAAIGTGNIFRGAHLPCYPDIAQAQLVALCDPDKTALDLAYKKYQSLMEAKIRQALEADDLAAVERFETDLETVQLCDDISEVIETIKPDLVDICTQPFLHTPLAIEALEAGLHVMCEKPLSRSWLESRRLIETIARTGKFYQHNENWLFDPDYYTVKKLVDSGAIGELTMMFLTQAHGGPEGSPKFWNSDFGGGGALLDNGIHAIGAAWYIAGLHKTPTLVKAAEPFGMSIRMPDRIIDGKYQHITVDDDAHILIRFEDKDTNAWTTAHVEGSWSEQDSPDTIYIGTTGSIKMLQEDGKRFAIVCDIKGQETRRFRVAGSNWQHWPSSFYGEILNMVQCVRNNQQSIMTAQFGADCSAIVGASYLSEKNGKRAVSLDEFRRFATDIADRYPNDEAGANNALVDALLSAVRNK